MKNNRFSRLVSGIPLAFREWHIMDRLHYHLLAALAVTALLIYLGPFGTWERHGLLIRTFYWSTAIGVIWIFALLVLPAVVTSFIARGWPDWAGITIGSGLVAIPGTGTVALLQAAVGEPSRNVFDLVQFYLGVVVILLAVALPVYYLIERPHRMRQAVQPGPTAPRPPAGHSFLLERLSDPLGRELLHLRMQDHYVEVHTTKGRELILMRFRDALQEAGHWDGMQVHRSHWVARTAVTGSVRRGSQTCLKLSTGETVPVSRSFLPALRKSGWLPDSRQ